jgi:hypothetical protein
VHECFLLLAFGLGHFIKKKKKLKYLTLFISFLFLYFKNILEKNNFFMMLNRFEVKNKFLKIKKYFNVFLSKKYFEKQLLSQYQTNFNC